MLIKKAGLKGDLPTGSPESSAASIPKVSQKALLSNGFDINGGRQPQSLPK